jgi:hypothetical protein
VTTHYLPQSLKFGLQPAIGWITILSFVGFTLLSLAAGLGNLLNLAYPAGALVVGVILYIRYPILYHGFSWWMWFLTPFVRRLVDQQIGFIDPSPMLLAPFLVSMVTVITLARQLPSLGRRAGLPFILVVAGITYGFLIGLIKRHPVGVCLNFLQSLAPVLLGFHIFANWRMYPDYRRNITRVFVWGVLIMGSYGIIQFLVLPEWDKSWLISTELTSQGNPEPLAVRVWSTMNSVEPFGSFIAAGLLVVLSASGPLQIPAIIVGFLAFLLTAMRSAWLAWFVGLLAQVKSLKSSLQIRLIATFLAIALLLVPLAMMEPFSEMISERVSTFSNLSEDSSVEARQRTYRTVAGQAATEFIGGGLGAASDRVDRTEADSAIDSAILTMLLNLGWVGTSFYLGGLLLLVFAVFQGTEGNFDPFVAAAHATVISAIIRLPVNDPISGVSGVILWFFLGVSMAARMYYKSLKTPEAASPIKPYGGADLS